MAKRKRGHGNRKDFFFENYKLSWKYIKESRNFIYFSIIIFLLFALIGFFVPVPESLRVKILEILKDIVKQTEGFNVFQMIQFIFVNNLKSSFFGIVFGIVFGIFPIISSLLNGYILGFVASLSVNAEGFIVLWKLFPHGIFELPAVFISLGMGLKFGTFIFEKKKKNALKSNLFNSMRVFLFVVIPLLIIAALIEGILIIVLG
jgi:stage II sporulation protein M